MIHYTFYDTFYKNIENLEKNFDSGGFIPEQVYLATNRFLMVFLPAKLHAICVTYVYFDHSKISS